MKEIWKKLDFLEGRYEVSNLGNCRHTGSLINRKIYYGSSTKKGDRPGKVTIRINSKEHQFSIHRLVAIAFLENPNNLPQINHIDGSRKNNKVDNLEWCDQSYNIKHAYNTGLKVMPLRKLSHKDLEVIYTLLEREYSFENIAKMFSVDASVISDIVNSKTYTREGIDFSKFSKSYYTNKARQDIKTIQELYKKLKSSNKIGELYNVSGRFIRRLLR